MMFVTQGENVSVTVLLRRGHMMALFRLNSSAVHLESGRGPVSRCKIGAATLKVFGGAGETTIRHFFALLRFRERLAD
jgi:hypothetical protein